MRLKPLDRDLALATSMNIDLIVIFKVVLTFYVVVALKFNQPQILSALP